MWRTKTVVRVVDLFAEPVSGPMAKFGDARSLIAVPMLKEDVLIGAITIYRQEVRPFTDKQIELVQNFAAQAVIAIENTRLLSELREALEQQTATSEVLSVISSSPGELEPVFNAVLENAVRICGAKFGNPILREGEGLRIGATFGTPQAYVDFLHSGNAFDDLQPGGGSRAAAQDQGTLPAHRHSRGTDQRRQAARSHHQTCRRAHADGVPMLKGDEAIGAIIIYRQEVRPFTDKQIELLTNFAAQAVIAIENTRLLSELRESLQQQTATADVLRVISSSPGELDPVFQAMLDSATRLCEAPFGILLLRDGALLRIVCRHVPPDVPTKVFERGSEMIFAENQNHPLVRMVEAREFMHIADLTTDPAYIGGNRRVVAFVDALGARAALCVPMMKDNECVGGFVIFRRELRPFSDKQIELVQNFAAQAVIAIENTRLLNELRQRTDDLTESLEQQTATSEVLRVISSSRGELEPVFEALLENATRICNAGFGNLMFVEGDGFRHAKLHGAPLAYAQAMQNEPVFRPGQNHPLKRLLATKNAVHVADAKADPAMRGRLVELAGARSLLIVPMLLQDKVIGAFGIYRQEVKLFTDKQIALLENFAAQAVIAIENTRLLSELRQSLEQQTATADVLKVISSSPGELEPVFQAMLENATRICEAKFGTLLLCEDDALRAVALHGGRGDYADERRRNPVFRPAPNVPVMRAVRMKQVQHVADMRTEQAYIDRDTAIVTMVETAGARTFLAVPMLKDDKAVGVIIIYRQEVRPFTDKQIELVQNFAAQAVIAIENTRLLSELRESLQQQTATADVLKVISRSTFDLQAVLNTLIESAARLCEADMAAVARQFENTIRHVANFGFPPDSVEYMKKAPVDPGRGSVAGRALADGQIVHVHDVQSDAAYTMTQRMKILGARTTLGVPLLREGKPIGVIVLMRKAVSPFSDKQIELVATFADQAVIAIENVRLFEAEQQRTRELTETLEQQTATAEILGVISKSLSDTQPVFDAIVQSGVRLFPGAAIFIALADAGEVRAAAIAEADPARAEAWRQRFPFPLTRAYIHSTAILDRTMLDIPDVENAPDEMATGKQNFLASGYRAVTIMPMMRGDAAIGALSVVRREPGRLSDKQIAVLNTFAAQAVIAIENTRLLSELRQRTADLTESLEDLRAAQDRLVQTEKLASLGQLTAGIAHEIKNPLNFVNNFSAVSVELIDELREALAGAPLDSKLRAEIGEIADTLQGNLDKVVQHGKRADSIVRNMLLHSRQGSGERRPVDINALVEESLNLAYHGARAEKQGFNITIEKSFDSAAGEVDLFPQEITRVLLNLISNGFYAATKRKSDADGGSYEPTLAAATKNLGDRVEIRIRDNGIGIPPEVKDKMFNPFFTTKPAGEGTGLGLSISHDIVVKQHSGSIAVDTEPGKFTEFKIVLPRAGASLIKSGERA